MKLNLILTLVFILTLTFLNLGVNNFHLENELQAQTGTNYMTCDDHPQNCDQFGSVGCQGGVIDFQPCMINCPPVTGPPWLWCGSPKPVDTIN